MRCTRFPCPALVGMVFAVAAAAPSLAPQPQAQRSVVTVYKSPACGCCNKWVEHLRAAGFKVEVHDLDDVTPYKDRNAVPVALRSCHTALVDGYVAEGHVPADVLQKFLRERPKASGLAVPGMPLGAPGMEGPQTEHYDVLTFEEGGRTTVYTRR